MGVLKGGVRQGVGTDRECGYLRCQILHVWVLFPPDYTLKITIPCYMLTGRAGTVSKKSM